LSTGKFHWWTPQAKFQYSGLLSGGVTLTIPSLLVQRGRIEQCSKFPPKNVLPIWDTELLNDVELMSVAVPHVRFTKN